MNTLRFKSIIASFSIAVLVLFSSCGKEVFGVNGSGPAVTETRQLGNFTGVQLSIDADVILHIDPNYHVTVTGQQNVLAVLETDVRGGKLYIDFDRNVYSHSNVTVHVYAPSYAYTALSGSGNISCSDSISSSFFEARISGSGDISISHLTATDVTTHISGSGDISISGTTTNATTSTSGSGSTKLFGLAGVNGDTQISGSGNVEINVSQTLKVRISGSGDVYYKQTPAVDIEISGSGKVQHVP